MKWTLDKFAALSVILAITVLALQASGMLSLPAVVAQFVPWAMAVAAGSGVYILYKVLAKNAKPF